MDPRSPGRQDTYDLREIARDPDVVDAIGQVGERVANRVLADFCSGGPARYHAYVEGAVVDALRELLAGDAVDSLPAWEREEAEASTVALALDRARGL